jgi:Asp-tRNA(Asn)/Glu-tRNA(Gln) amidotransferase A subunit family amidase
MSKRWYNFFVTVDQGAEAAAPSAESAPTPAQTVADIAASLAAEPKFTAPAADPASFDDIYRQAEIQTPVHGYTILKVASMLLSEHIRGLPAEVRRSSILVALDAAGVKVTEVIEDAVKRDRALDTYERVLETNLKSLEARKTEENRAVEAEMEKMIAEYRARIQANSDEIAREKERFYGWRLQKQQEEKKIAEAVAYFVSENPISASGAAAAPPPGPKRQGS